MSTLVRPQDAAHLEPPAIERAARRAAVTERTPRDDDRVNSRTRTRSVTRSAPA